MLIDIGLTLSSLSLEAFVDCQSFKQRRAQLSQHHAKALRSACAGAVQHEQQVGDEGCIDLNAHCVLALAQEALDLQVVLDPFEEQLDLPALLVELGDLRCAGVHIVGGQHQWGGLVRSGDHDAPQRLGVGIAMGAREGSSG